MVRPNRKIQMFSKVGVGLHSWINRRATVLTMVAVKITGLRPSLSPNLTKRMEPKKKPMRIKDPKSARSDLDMQIRLYLVIQLLRVNLFE